MNKTTISPINGLKNNTAIEWCHWPNHVGETLNPVIAFNNDTRVAADGAESPFCGERGWHCEVVSEGCKDCYAQKMNIDARYMGTGLRFQKASRDKVKIELHEPTLLKPLGWKAPRAIFWGDMTDLFGEWVPFDWIDKCFAVMALTPQHKHMILTTHGTALGSISPRSTSRLTAGSRHRAETPLCFGGVDDGLLASDIEYLILTVAELFALSGFPVPEGAKLRCRQPGLWIANSKDTGEVWHFTNDYSGNPAIWQWDVYRSVRDCNEFVWPDLSRLPAADAFECLPEPVRSIVDAGGKP